MLCSKCNKREAKVYCTEIIQGEKKEQYLCEECAAEYASFQMESAGFHKDSALSGLLSGILGSYAKEQSAKEKPVEKITCGSCGMTYEEFLQLEKFGCAGCYKSFGRSLSKSFKQIQGADTHAGKKPAGYISAIDKMVKELSEVEKLSLRLQESIEKEEFEEAALLRDKIKELKEFQEQEVPNA